MSKWFEGISILLKENYSFKITPNMDEIDLSEYEIKAIQLKYEHKHCGYCEGDHCSIEINSEDLFEFKDSGGLKEMNKQKKFIKELKTHNKKLKQTIKKLESTIKTIKEA